MLEFPEVIHHIIHEFLNLPLSITITNKNIKDNFIDNRNLKIVLYHKNVKNTFIDNYKKDLRKLYLLIQKYSYYENEYKINEPISSILIDLLCTECSLPYALSTHYIFTNDTFNDLKEIIRIVPESLTTTYGQLRCRYNLSPLDMACQNLNIPLFVIEYILDKGADMYHLYQVNGCKTHILEDIKDMIDDLSLLSMKRWRERYDNLNNLFESKGFNKKKINKILSICDKRYLEMYS